MSFVVIATTIESITSNLNQYLADIYHKNNTGQCYMPAVENSHTVKKIWHKFEVSDEPVGAGVAYDRIGEMIFHELNDFFETPDSEWFMKKSIITPTIHIRELADFRNWNSVKIQFAISAAIAGSDLTYWELSH